jgi:hypothetical protein
VSIVVDADSAEDATRRANSRGILVSKVYEVPPPSWTEWVRRNQALVGLLCCIGAFLFIGFLGSIFSDEARDRRAAQRAQAAESARVAALTPEERAAEREARAQRRAEVAEQRARQEQAAREVDERKWLSAAGDGRYFEGVYFVSGGVTNSVPVREGYFVQWKADFLNVNPSTQYPRLRVSWIGPGGERLHVVDAGRVTLLQGRWPTHGQDLIPADAARRAVGVEFQLRP